MTHAESLLRTVAPPPTPARASAGDPYAAHVFAAVRENACVVCGESGVGLLDGRCARCTSSEQEGEPTEEAR